MPFQDAYERILQSTGLRTQTDVAALLGVKQSSISDAKRRNHIPDSWILTLFNKKGLNPSWIRTGEGQGRRSIWQRRGAWHRNMNVLYRAELRENERRKI